MGPLSWKGDMATPAVSLGIELSPYLRERLATIPAVESAYFSQGENAFFIWVGIREDEANIRKAVYAVEDELSERYPDFCFDFRVIPLPRIAGSKTSYRSRKRPISALRKCRTLASMSVGLPRI